MFLSGHSPAICFVWQPSDLDAAALDIDRMGLAQIIVDLSNCSVVDFQDIDNLVQDIDVKISLKQFFDVSIGEFLKKRRIRTVWLEYFEDLLPCDFATFVNRLESYKMLIPQGHKFRLSRPAAQLSFIIPRLQRCFALTTSQATL